MIILLEFAGLAAFCFTIWWLLRPRPAKPFAAPAPLSQTYDTDRAKVAAEERERIYADLHDDIGAKLLTLVHSLENPAHADLARSVLQDLRDIVSRSRGGVSGTLLEVLAQIRDETEQRLDVSGAELAWEQQSDLPDPTLDEGQALHLFRIVREAVTNAIRHGHAKRVRVRVRNAKATLIMDVADDGHTPIAATGESAPGGRGVENMKQRAAELQGTIEWNPATSGGTKVVLQFPLPNMPDQAA